MWVRGRLTPLRTTTRFRREGSPSVSYPHALRPTAEDLEIPFVAVINGPSSGVRVLRPGPRLPGGFGRR